MNPHHSRRIPRWLLPALAALPLAHLSAGDAASPAPPAAIDSAATGAAEHPWTFSSEFNSRYSYAGRGDADRGKVSEQASHADYVLTSQYKEGPPIRFGVSWQNISFSSTTGTRFPNTLQQETLIAGLDLQVLSSAFLRIEAQPGFYSASSRLFSDALAVPFVVGGSYVYSKDLQFILGVSIDYDRANPVLPGGGIRWQATSKLLFDAVLPKPRVEYEVNKKASLYAGAEFEDSTYRTDSSFAPAFHSSNLKGAWIDYYEVRLGGGAMVKLSEKLSIDLTGGYIIHRTFSYNRSEFDFFAQGGGIYGGISLSAKF